MSKKNYFTYALIIFLTVAVVHGLRVIRSLDLKLGSYEVPMWLSGAAFVLAIIMAYYATKFAKGR